MSVTRIFIANRGEIALRVIRAATAAGLETVLGVSEADRDSLPARMASRTVCLGPAPASASYLNIDAVVTAAKGTGCDALHPGYGFLAENAALADLCAAQGITFIGPRGDTIRALGDKITARGLAETAGVPVVPGRDQITDFADAKVAAAAIGYPVLLKATAGGGGRGMQVVRSEADLQPAFDTARAEARAAFGNDTLYLERFIGKARHVEVQVLGDRFGTVLHLGERDCTLQRRHQKIVEEGPALHVPAAIVAQMRAAAVDLAASVGYEGAGTVEFIYDTDASAFYFLEVNTRIQVEHPVTEMLTGVDLVAQQIRIANGLPLDLAQSDIILTGHAIECRITAENAAAGFRPSPGLITSWQAPTGVDIRLDSHCHAGYNVPPYYDSLLGKLIVTGPDRDTALARMRAALQEFVVEGIDTTLPFLQALLARSEFEKGTVSTRWVEAVMKEPDFSEQVNRGQR